MRSWIYLFIAILFELAGTTCMKFSDGFNNLSYSVLMILCYVCSISLLTIAVKGINLSIAYAVWSGLGTALIAIIGVIFFKESLSPSKIVFILWIILGVIGLNLTSK